ncbi:TetR/AcrR family transcriptional regulator [Sphaerisporangium sp. B11E5]|uniref:TetR/AcrR family transcriptional regulator n=1 Tax=Sphaerisporangium sp. B11E5 TaxID=3153563 RepID=UPI00325DD630
MPRDTLTREQIVRAAVTLLDDEGIEGLSMRRLGARLGSAATAVYWHVRNKDDLVVLASDAVWAEIELPDAGRVGWRAAVTAMAEDAYAMIMRHPWLVPAMSTHVIYGPGKARHDDHALSVYEAAGFAGADAEHAATLVFTFVLGMALGTSAEVAWRTRLRREEDGGEEKVRAVMERVTEIATGFPHLRARTEAWQAAEPDTAAGGELAFGLQAILDGLEARLARLR